MFACSYYFLKVLFGFHYCLLSCVLLADLDCFFFFERRSWDFIGEFFIAFVSSSSTVPDLHGRFGLRANLKLFL